MQCENCGNEDAVVQLTTVKENEMRVLHLCQSCAADKGVESGATGGALPLADFLAQMGKGVAEETPGLGACPSCGLTPGQLKQSGRLGCSQCYGHFEQHLRGLLRRLHGATQHVGKTVTPRSAEEQDRTARVESLRRSLQRAVDAEDFEHAASLRDQIRRMEASE